jgi:hypothetical protein
VQQAIHAFRVDLSWINFFWQDVDGKYLRAIPRFADKSYLTPKYYQAACRHTQDRSHLQISRALNKKVKFGRISIKVVSQEFLLRCLPVLEVEAMFAAAFLKNLKGTFGDRRLDDLLMWIFTALDDD